MLYIWYFILRILIYEYVKQTFCNPFYKRNMNIGVQNLTKLASA